jgi:hypothetical protein
MSLVLEAKRIFVLEDGRLVQSGTHRELFDQDGAYRKIMQAYIETLKIEKLEDRSTREPILVPVRPDGPIFRSDVGHLGEGRSGHAGGDELPPGEPRAPEAPIPMIDAREEG